MGLEFLFTCCSKLTSFHPQTSFHRIKRGTITNQAIILEPGAAPIVDLENQQALGEKLETEQLDDETERSYGTLTDDN